MLHTTTHRDAGHTHRDVGPLMLHTTTVLNHMLIYHVFDFFMIPNTTLLKMGHIEIVKFLHDLFLVTEMTTTQRTSFLVVRTPFHQTFFMKPMTAFFNFAPIICGFVIDANRVDVVIVFTNLCLDIS